jgi:hypothetical protein
VSLHRSGAITRLPVAALAAGTLLVPLVFLPGSTLCSLLCAAGLVACVGVVAGLPGAVTGAAVAAIAAVAVPETPSPVVVLATAALLAATLAAAETAENGRWRLGLRQVIATHGPAAALGLAGAGAALLAGSAALTSAPLAVAAALLAVSAIGALILVLAPRRR